MQGGSGASKPQLEPALRNDREVAGRFHGLSTAKLVEVSWEALDREVCLHIDDRGPGISEEAKRRLFDPFFTTRPKGHGLGLAIARTLARAHGGDVRLTTREGGGVRATLSLPIDVVRDAATEREAA